MVSRTRRWLYRLFAALLAMLLAVVLTEVVARLVFDLPPATFFVAEERDGQTWITDNPVYGRTFQTPQHARAPAQNLFAAEKPDGTQRILVLGESAAMGFPSPEFGLARTLIAHLKRAYPGQTFDVIDGTMTLINSHLLREIAAEAMKFSPDAVVIYAGNNEFIGPYGAASIFGRAYSSLWMIRADRWLRTRSVLVRGLTGMLRDRAFRENPRWMGLDHFQRTPVRLDDPVVRRVEQHFHANLHAIASKASSRGIPVVAITPAVHLRAWPPLYSFPPEGLRADTDERWRTLVKEAALLSSRQRWERALGRWQEAREIFPEHAETVYQIARCLEALGRYEEVRELDERACMLDGYRFRASSRMADAVREIAGSIPSVRLIDARSALYPLDAQEPEIFLEHVHFTMQGMDQLACLVVPGLSSALQHADGVSSAVTFEEITGDLLFLPDHLIEAQNSLQQFLEMEVFKGQTGYEERVKRAQSRQLAAEALAAEMTVDDVLARLEKAREQAASPPWILDYLAGRTLHYRGSYDEAAALFTSAVAAKPNQPFHHQWLGFARYALGDFYAARAALEKGLGIYPFMHDGLNILGLSRYQLGDRAGARAAYQQVLTINPRQGDAMNNLGYLEYEEGNLELALDLLGRAVRENPDSAEARFHLALALTRRGALPEASAELERVVQARPDMARAWNAWGMALMQMGQAALADEKFTRALELDPERDDARMQRAFIWMQINREPGRAVPEFKQVLDRKPDLAAARFLYGMAMTGSGGVEEGIKHIREAVAAAPEQSDWKMQLAQMLMAQGKDNQAYMEEARKLVFEVWDASGQSDPAAARLLDVMGGGGKERRL